MKVTYEQTAAGTEAEVEAQTGMTVLVLALPPSTTVFEVDDKADLGVLDDYMSKSGAVRTDPPPKTVEVEVVELADETPMKSDPSTVVSKFEEK